MRIELSAGIADRNIHDSAGERSRKLNVGGSLDEVSAGDGSSRNKTGAVARFEAPGNDFSLGVTERRVAVRRGVLGWRAER